MSASELTQVLRYMPDSYLETCILDCLTKMLANGEWKLVDSILPNILTLVGRIELKASALSIGVKTALRQREIELALDRYNMLENLGNSYSIILARLDALSSLAIYLLPNQLTRMEILWQKINASDLPNGSKNDWARLGIKLACAYGKCGDFEGVVRLRQVMERELGTSLFQQVAHKFGKGIFGGR